MAGLDWRFFGRRFIITEKGSLPLHTGCPLLLRNRRRCRRGRELSHFFDQPSKAELAKRLLQRRHIGQESQVRVPGKIKVEVLVQADQFATQVGLVGIRFQILTQFGSGRFVRVGEDVFECPEFLQHSGRFFGADQRHAGDIVDGVTDKRLKVNDLIGSNSPVEQQT